MWTPQAVSFDKFLHKVPSVAGEAAGSRSRLQAVRPNELKVKMRNVSQLLRRSHSAQLCVSLVPQETTCTSSLLSLSSHFAPLSHASLNANGVYPSEHNDRPLASHLIHFFCFYQPIFILFFSPLSWWCAPQLPSSVIFFLLNTLPSPKMHHRETTCDIPAFQTKRFEKVEHKMPACWIWMFPALVVHKYLLFPGCSFNPYGT